MHFFFLNPTLLCFLLVRVCVSATPTAGGSRCYMVHHLALRHSTRLGSAAPPAPVVLQGDVRGSRDAHLSLMLISSERNTVTRRLIASLCYFILCAVIVQLPPLTDGDHKAGLAIGRGYTLIDSCI